MRFLKTGKQGSEVDRTQRKVLYVLNKMRTDEDFNATKFYNQTKIFDIDKMYQLCKDLEDDHWIDFLATDLTKRITMIELSYKGITYRYHLWCSFLKKSLGLVYRQFSGAGRICYITHRFAAWIMKTAQLPQ